MLQAEIGTRRAMSELRRMKNRGIEKSPGVSSLEIDGIVYQFVAGDQSHVKSDHIYKLLDNLSISCTNDLVLSSRS